jgi:folate-binding protein YgfZ
MTVESPLLETHRAAGAELAPFLGVMLPAQFSSPRAEHEFARTTAVLVDTSFRTIFSLAGADRLRYLNAVTTGNIRGLASGQGALGLLLNSQGHILAELETFALEDRLLIFGHTSAREITAQVLDKYIIMDDATLTDETAESGTLAIEGPEAPSIIYALTGVDLKHIPVRGHVAATLSLANAASGVTIDAANIAKAILPIPCRVIRHSLYGFPGAELLVARKHLATAWHAAETAVSAHHGAPIGYHALNALRLEAGIPWFGVDFGEHQIPHEAGLESTHISFTKGCYTGQEIVERVRSRGHVNRRLTGLRFGAPEPPQPGAKLAANGTEAGHVTSAEFSPLLESPIGMCYVRREYNQAGSILQCGSDAGEVRTEVIALPLPTAQPATA